MRRLFPMLLLAACGAGTGTELVPPDAGLDAEPEPDATPLPTLEIGSSDSGFVPLVAGGPIFLIKGTQGGFHLDVNARATRIAPGNRSETLRLCSDVGTFENPCVNIDVVDLMTGKQLDTFAPLRLPFTETEPGVFDLLPPREVRLVIGGFADVEGHPFQVIVTIDDAGGQKLRAEVVVTCTPAR